MRITTAASLADYMQTEIRISTSVINSGTLPLLLVAAPMRSVGISDARTSLGLGSAATHDVGTDSGDVVELNANGRFNVDQVGEFLTEAEFAALTTKDDDTLYLLAA